MGGRDQRPVAAKGTSPSAKGGTVNLAAIGMCCLQRSSSFTTELIPHHPSTPRHITIFLS